MKDKILKKDVLIAIDHLMDKYGSNLDPNGNEVKLAENIGAIKALEKLKRDLGMAKMVSGEKKSLK